MISRSILRAIFLAALLLPSCKKEVQVLPPVIHADLSPASGNTTQVFNFDLSGSESRNGRSSKVFTRWDWNGDGTWDTPFTRMLVYEQRCYVPGSWHPRLEMTNLDGGSDTLGFSIPVARGYSSPKPVLKATPVKGHIFTRFMLDASGTRDDEDSLDQLTFRWDFEGDGQWDTFFGDSMTMTHRYEVTGIYKPKIQVKDPSGLIGTEQAQVNVTIEDPRLLVSFRCIPDSVTNNTPIIMDASASSDLDYPDTHLFYRWDWNNDRVWDTEWLTEPQTIHVFEEEFLHFVRLQVRSQRGLMNETVLKIRVFHRNHEPLAAFGVSTFTGNVNTWFRFDCWSVRDYESAPSDLFYRWDFDGDGSWDTGFANSVITLHQYDRPGIFKTLLEVEDPHGGRDTCSKLIYISRGTNQTGIYEDITGLYYQSYGTVRIGGQWWFTRNLTTKDTARFYQSPFNNNWPDYFYYGNLYTSGELGCPPGWRVPSREDWDKLFANYAEDRLLEALTPGGESDFGANLGGQGSGVAVPTATFRDLGNLGYYWTATKPMDPGSTSVWVITFDKPNRKVLQGFFPAGNKMYSARCVKDAN